MTTVVESVTETEVISTYTTITMPTTILNNIKETITKTGKLILLICNVLFALTKVVAIPIIVTDIQTTSILQMTTSIEPLTEKEIISDSIIFIIPSTISKTITVFINVAGTPIVVTEGTTTTEVTTTTELITATETTTTTAVSISVIQNFISITTVPASISTITVLEKDTTLTRILPGTTLTQTVISTIVEDERNITTILPDTTLIHTSIPTTVEDSIVITTALPNITVTQTLVYTKTLPASISMMTLLEDATSITTVIPATTFIQNLVTTIIIPTSKSEVIKAGETSTASTNIAIQISETVTASGKIITQHGEMVTAPVNMVTTIGETKSQIKTEMEPKKETETITTIISEVVICPVPSATISPTAKPFNPDSDLTWGCRPGYICSPKKPKRCNIWAVSPAPEYVCAASSCVEAPGYAAVDWGDNNETGYFPPSPFYFNLAPIAFGLSYEIFEIGFIKVEESDGSSSIKNVSTGNWASQTSITSFDTTMLTVFSEGTPTPFSKRETNKSQNSHRIEHHQIGHLLVKRGGTPLPSVCYDTCNNGFLEAQMIGKLPSLCDAGSAFRGYYDGCRECINTYSNSSDSDRDGDKYSVVRREYLQPEFSQWVDYCEVGLGISLDTENDNHYVQPDAQPSSFSSVFTTRSTVNFESLQTSRVGDDNDVDNEEGTLSSTLVPEVKAGSLEGEDMDNTSGALVSADVLISSVEAKQVNRGSRITYLPTVVTTVTNSGDGGAGSDDNRDDDAINTAVVDGSTKSGAIGNGSPIVEASTVINITQSSDGSSVGRSGNNDKDRSTSPAASSLAKATEANISGSLITETSVLVTATLLSFSSGGNSSEEPSNETAMKTVTYVTVNLATGKMARFSSSIALIVPVLVLLFWK